MGYPAAGMRNYLARLGWSHGDDEFFTDAQAREWFDLDGIGKSPARFDSQEAGQSVGPAYRAAEDAALLHESRPICRHRRKPLDRRSGRASGVRCIASRNARKPFPNCLKRLNFVLTERPIQPDEKAAKALDPMYPVVYCQN
jgi:glutamyl-tRNA synthetase